uniref:Uncharacterized protein n=1 Tax=Arundo donax TaxID=35708 RepID=A0A0A9H4M3_ARUDO
MQTISSNATSVEPPACLF